MDARTDTHKERETETETETETDRQTDTYTEAETNTENLKFLLFHQAPPACPFSSNSSLFPPPLHPSPSRPTTDTQ